MLIPDYLLEILQDSDVAIPNLTRISPEPPQASSATQVLSRTAESTLTDVNESHDWRIYQNFATRQIRTTKTLYSNDHFVLKLEQTVFALNTTIIDLCLSVFPWARFRHCVAQTNTFSIYQLGMQAQL